MLSMALAYGPHSDTNTEHQQSMPQCARSDRPDQVQFPISLALYALPLGTERGYTGKPALAAADEV